MTLDNESRPTKQRNNGRINRLQDRELKQGAGNASESTYCSIDAAQRPIKLAQHAREKITPTTSKIRGHRPRHAEAGEHGVPGRRCSLYHLAWRLALRTGRAITPRAFASRPAATRKIWTVRPRRPLPKLTTRRVGTRGVRPAACHVPEDLCCLGHATKLLAAQLVVLIDVEQVKQPASVDAWRSSLLPGAGTLSRRLPARAAALKAITSILAWSLAAPGRTAAATPGSLDCVDARIARIDARVLRIAGGLVFAALLHVSRRSRFAFFLGGCRQGWNHGRRRGNQGDAPPAAHRLFLHRWPLSVRIVLPPPTEMAGSIVMKPGGAAKVSRRNRRSPASNAGARRPVATSPKSSMMFQAR